MPSLPAYAHRPGRTPHPRTHVNGHSRDAPEPSSGPLLHDNWRDHEAWLFGVELYNRGYWWEAHEWWEAAWHATRDDRLRHLLQGLIQLAATWLKWEAGNERGRRGLWRRSRTHLLAAAGSAPTAGVDLGNLVEQLDSWFVAHPTGPSVDPGPTQLTLHR